MSFLFAMVCLTLAMACGGAVCWHMWTLRSTSLVFRGPILSQNVCTPQLGPSATKLGLSSENPRIVILGMSGSGKSTLGRELSQKLHIEHIELDLLWHTPNWTHREPGEFRRLVKARIDQAEENGGGWVIDGIFSHSTDLVWSRATVLVWLNHAFIVNLARLTKRTFRRCLLQTPICNGNYESFYTQLCTKESLFFWLFTRFWSLNKELQKNLLSPQHINRRGWHVDCHQALVLRLRSPADVVAFTREFVRHYEAHNRQR